MLQDIWKGLSSKGMMARLTVLVVSTRRPDPIVRLGVKCDTTCTIIISLVYMHYRVDSGTKHSNLKDKILMQWQKRDFRNIRGTNH